jgi:hypothetical protein
MGLIQCSVQGCDVKMKDRINGSHLKRKHNLTLNEYVTLYPNAELGHYNVSTFICKICEEKITNKSEIKLSHLKLHGLNNIDEYNLKYNIKNCECGCGQISDYSFIRHKFNNFKNGHYKSWNEGLTKETDDRINSSKAGGWNRGLTKNNNNIMQEVSNKVIKFWNENPQKKSQMATSIKKTMLKKYNVENVNDCPQFWAKYKDYQLPSGKIVRIQGYENLGLDLLLKEHDETNIIVDRKVLPKFYYNNGKKYTPDIFIINKKTIYEVKSTWTYKIFKNKKEKIKSVNDAGYDYILLIFNGKGETIIKEYKIKK